MESARPIVLGATAGPCVAVVAVAFGLCARDRDSRSAPSRAGDGHRDAQDA